MVETLHEFPCMFPPNMGAIVFCTSPGSMYPGNLAGAMAERGRLSARSADSPLPPNPVEVSAEGGTQLRNGRPGAERELCGSCAEKLRELCGSCAGAVRELCGSCAEKLRELCGKAAGAVRKNCGGCAGKLRESVLKGL